MTNQLIESVKKQLQTEHDTLYVNQSQHLKLKREVATPGLSTSVVDDVKICGLEVITITDLDFAILCQKGDVFPLAKDWQENTNNV